MTFKPIETQEDFDAAVKERIERAKKSATEKYSDYDAIKAELQGYRDAEAAGKSELEKLTEKVAAMEKEKADKQAADAKAELRRKVAGELKVPEALIQGEDEEAMRASAKAVSDYAQAYKPPAPRVPGAGKSAQDAKAGVDSDMRDFVSQLFGDTE